MRILFFADNFKPETNAPATHIYERCREWVRWGHDVTVVTTAPNFPEGRVYPGYRNRLRGIETIDGIRVVRGWTYVASNEGFARRTLDYLSYVPSAFLNACFEDRPDVAISSSPQLFTAVAGSSYCALRGIPHVLEVRDLWPASILATSAMKPGRVYRTLERLELALYRRSRRILSFTESFVPDLTSRGVPRDKIDVVINGASLDSVSAQRRPRRRTRTPTGIGGTLRRRVFGDLGSGAWVGKRVARAEATRESPITYLFVGGGALRERLESLKAEKRLENVLLIPRVDKAELARYWSLCDASLVHLKNDPLFAGVIPSKIFESMAVGLPIVYVGPPGEGDAIVRRHDAGITLAPDRPAELAVAIERLRTDSRLRATLAANSLAAAPLYSRERQARRTLNVLRRALGEQVDLDARD
ncbi:MAG: glycosyltransferase family 4 protein [Pirellulales bacterium]